MKIATLAVASLLWGCASAPDVKPAAGYKVIPMARAEAPKKLPLLADVVARASNGDDNAVHELCYRYKNGIEAPVSHADAFAWCKRGAALGLAGSQVLFAELHHLGEGMPKDDATAIIWYGKAAEQDHPNAFRMLYLLYGQGWGAPKDTEKAVGYLKRLAMQGNESAIDELEKIDAGMQTETRRAAGQAGDLKAQEALGGHYHYGPVIFRDYAEAAKWYALAAAQGSALAQNNLGDLHEHGQGVPQDFAKAAAHYRQAASQGYQAAFHGLATLYQSGKGVTRSPYLAYTYYLLTKAVDSSGPLPEDAAKKAVQLSAVLTPGEQATAANIADTWKPGLPLPQ